MNPIVSLASGLCRNRDALISREWLVTNGLGGYAMGTVAGATTRAYHGYLIAATDPPVGRTLLLQQITEVVHRGWQRFVLGDDEWLDTDAPPYNAQSLVLESFALDGTLPAWTFSFEGTRLEKRVWMAHGHNTTYVRYTLLESPGPVRLELIIGVNDRDHHDASVDDGSTWHTSTDGSIVTTRRATPESTTWRMLAEHDAPFVAEGAWSDALFLRVEAERGLTSTEQRYTLGRYEIDLQPGESWTLIATTESIERVERDSAVALRAERDRQAALIAQANAENASGAVRQLVLAADQFVVARGSRGADDSPGHTIIAGYPWFGDWGRDTMISLPGICLSTRRFDLAASMLRTFAQHVSEGMLPNRFPDIGEQPEYNTVDATLWYFDAIDRYVRATDDRSLLGDLYSTLAEIVDWHVRGTRYGIGVDPADGLLRAGEPGAQLTWMDVRIDAWVVTPRHGKAIEINALWYRALRLMAGWASQYGSPGIDRHDYPALAERVRVAFDRFWYAGGGYLYDVLDTPDGDDATLRPNQVLALSVAPELVPDDRRRAALDVVGDWLWTPVGLRTLDPRDPEYRPRFSGDRIVRDSAYHQGTIWPWLIGHYIDARRRIDPALDMRPLIQPLLDHLWDAGLGTISETFDAEPPRFGAGCMAQAWSVAELLRSALE